MATASLIVSGVALLFSVWAWCRTQATARWDRWREKLSTAFRDDARYINHLAGKEPDAPLFVEGGPLTREFSKTAEVLSDLPGALRDSWVKLLTEAISAAGSDGILWWEVHLYTSRDERWKQKVPKRLFFSKGDKRPARL